MTKAIKDNLKVEITKLQKEIQRRDANRHQFFGDAKVQEIARLNHCKSRMQVLKNIVR